MRLIQQSKMSDLNMGSPKKISITNIRSNSKNKEMNSPTKVTSKDYYANQNNILILPNDSPSKKIVRKASNESISKSQLSLHGSEDQIKARSLMLDNLQEILQGIRTCLSEQENLKLVSALTNLNSIRDFTPFVKQFFTVYNYYHSINLQSDQSKQKQVTLPLRYKDAKKILFIEESTQPPKSTRNKKIIELTKQNQDLKKQVFKSRQAIKDLQKRIVLLIEQFKARKSVYLKEIEKLVSVIETSIKNIPDLITQKKQLISMAKMRTYNDLPITITDPKMTKRDSEYNTLFYNYNTKTDQNIEVSSIQRYKSQGKMRIKQ